MKVFLRSMYVSPPGYSLVAADLSQAESWIVAYLANEQSMKYSLNHSDIHTDSAAALFYPESPCLHKWKKQQNEERICVGCSIVIVKTARYIGKRYNHASAYRMKYVRAAEVINKDSDKAPYVTVTLAESQTFSERWHQKYSLKPWWSEIEWKLDKQARTLTTCYNFERTFFAAWGEELFKEATAFEPQSTVADHFNGAIHPELNVEGGMRVIYKKFVKPYNDHKIINQSHDSCMIECPTPVAEEMCQNMMRTLYRPILLRGEMFTIPVDGEVGDRWGELEERKLAA